jgi:hypothetical protein
MIAPPNTPVVPGYFKPTLDVTAPLHCSTPL